MAKPATTIPGKTRVLVADDHPMMRDSLVRLLEQQPDMCCCAEAGTVGETQEKIGQCRPDMVIMDLRLRNGDGIELIKSLKAQQPALPILVFSQHDSSVYAERSLRAGAMGYVTKDHAAEDLLEAIRTVASGRIYLTRGLAALLLHRFVGTPAKKGGDAQILTDRELHVLELLGTGLSPREAATALNISFKTVETHRENIKRKLGLHTATALTHYAVEWATKQFVLPADRSNESPPN